MNEELTRYLAAAVIKAGGEVRLTHEDRIQAFDLTLKVDDETDHLIISAEVAE